MREEKNKEIKKMQSQGEKNNLVYEKKLNDLNLIQLNNQKINEENLKKEKERYEKMKQELKNQSMKMKEEHMKKMNDFEEKRAQKKLIFEQYMKNMTIGSEQKRLYYQNKINEIENSIKQAKIETNNIIKELERNTEIKLNAMRENSQKKIDNMKIEHQEELKRLNEFYENLIREKEEALLQQLNQYDNLMYGNFY